MDFLPYIGRLKIQISLAAFVAAVVAVVAAVAVVVVAVAPAVVAVAAVAAVVVAVAVAVAVPAEETWLGNLKCKPIFAISHGGGDLLCYGLHDI